MKRLLIVDDEHHVVNWLVELFEDQTDLELVIYKSYSGLDALKILETTKIDVILLDIKMPGINGLDVAQNVISEWPGCRIIFLTGHNNFDYIYYANKHKNIAYLLKTEDDDEIIKAVTLAIESIDLEMKTIELANQMISKEKLLNYLFQKDFLKDIIMGKRLTKIKEDMDWFGCNFQLDLSVPVYILQGKLNLNYSSPYYIDHNNYILKLMQVMDQVLYNKFNYAILDVDHSTVLWFLQPSVSFLEKNQQLPLNYLKESFDDFIFTCQKILHCEMILLLYKKAVSWELTGNTYQLLNQYSSYSSPTEFSHSYAMIFGEEQENSLIEHSKDILQFNKWDKQLNALSTYLNQGDQENFMFILKEIISAYHEVKSMHYLPMISIYQKISSLLISYINQHNISQKIAVEMGIYPLFYMNDFKNWEDAFIFLDNIVNKIFDISSNTQLDKNHKLVKAVKNYVKNHLSDDLTLTTISDVVNYNSSYVSRTFKQTTGMSPSDYINQSRMNKAKELLTTTNDTVHVIAQIVGFDTSQYFSLVFRKSVGMTPSDFRSKV